MKTIITNSAGETYDIGYTMAKEAVCGTIIALTGDLGAGKTVFAKGFAAGLGINDHVTSPTFTIVCEYEGGTLPLYHFDVYRIDDPEELWEIGFEEYLYGQGVCLIEWADKIMDELPDDTIIVDIKRQLNQDTTLSRLGTDGTQAGSESFSSGGGIDMVPEETRQITVHKKDESI